MSRTKPQDADQQTSRVRTRESAGAFEEQSEEMKQWQEQRRNWKTAERDAE